MFIHYLYYYYQYEIKLHISFYDHPDSNQKFGKAYCSNEQVGNYLLGYNLVY